MSIKPQKSWRLNYWGDEPTSAEPQISLLGDPGEVRISAGPKSFLSIKEDNITMSGGFPSKFNVQGLESSFKYAGLVKPTPFWMSLIPSTIFTPFPRQRFDPPLRELIPVITQATIIATSLIGA